MSNQQTTPKPEFSEPAWFYRLQLRAPDPDKPTEEANMMFGLDGDTPVIEMWPRGDSQKGKGPIKARMNTTAFGLHLPMMMRSVAEGPPSTKGTLQYLGNRKDEGQYVQKVIGTIMCGKRADGVVVFGVFDVDDTRPRILFPFTQLDWIKTPEIDGSPIPEAELSVKTCLYYANFFERMCNDNALRQTTAERKAFQDEIRRKREERLNAGGGFNRPAQSNRSNSEFTLG